MTIDVFGIVQNSRRRTLLKILERDLGGNASLHEVVRRIAIKESNGDFDKKLSKSIQVSLIQSHLPKMEKAGLIRYNIQKGTIHLIELPRQVRYHLEYIEKHDIPWSVYYLILSGAGLILSIVFNNLLAGALSTSFLSGAMINWIQTRKKL